MVKVKDLVARIALGAALIDLPLVALGTVIRFPASWKVRAAKILVKQGAVKSLIAAIDYAKPDKKHKTIVSFQRRDIAQDYQLVGIKEPQTKYQNYNHFSNYQTYS